jgi:hypothetical protein
MLKKFIVFKFDVLKFNDFKFDVFNGERWDVRLDFVRQFKSELVRQLECLIFEEKKVYG